MRIIGGLYKGKSFKLKVPKNIRPTSDFVREAIYDTLCNYINIFDVNVLDLFAGTGMLGIEALSRGASFCQFVDNSKSSIQLLTNNIYSLNIEKDRFKITFADVFSFIKTYNKEVKFDLIFSDPPYNLDLNTKLMLNQGICKIARNGTIFVLETSHKSYLIESSNFKMFNKKEYGDTNVYYFYYEC